MTEETPVKVFSLLGAAMFSMFFLFAVSATNASFSGTESALPNIMGPDKVVSVLDNAANSYSSFLQAYLFQPAQEQLAFVQDNINYIKEEAGPSVLAFTGLNSLAQASSSSAQPQVAGAFISNMGSRHSGLSINSLYALLIR